MEQLQHQQLNQEPAKRLNGFNRIAAAAAIAFSSIGVIGAEASAATEQTPEAHHVALTQDAHNLSPLYNTQNNKQTCKTSEGITKCTEITGKTMTLISKREIISEKTLASSAQTDLVSTH